MPPRKVFELLLARESHQKDPKRHCVIVNTTLAVSSCCSTLLCCCCVEPVVQHSDCIVAIVYSFPTFYFLKKSINNGHSHSIGQQGV